jgi:hypothetical protein
LSKSVAVVPVADRIAVGIRVVLVRKAVLSVLILPATSPVSSSVSPSLSGRDPMRRRYRRRLERIVCRASGTAAIRDAIVVAIRNT